MQGFIMARDEIFWMLALIGVAVAVLWHFTLQNQEALVWSTAVLVQALPFVAAFITSMCNALPNMFKSGNTSVPVPSSSVPDSSVVSAAE
jgi:hypothetical protein